MTRFWAIAAAHWPLSLPRRRLEAAVGTEEIAALVASGLLIGAPLRAGETLPCATCRWPAPLVAEPEGLVAVCAGDCPWEAFGPEEARLRVQPIRLFGALTRALDLEGVPGPEALVTPLGWRSLGAEQVAFDFVARPTLEGVGDALHRLVRGGPRVRVLVVPSAARLPAATPTEIAGVDLVWVGLDQLLAVGPPVRADLRPLLARRHFPGLAVEAPFDGLVLTDRGARWRGRALRVEEAPLQLQLLRLLGQAPGALVTKAALWRELYPDDVNTQGRPVRGVNPEDLEDKLRALVLGLRASLREADPAAGDLVENRRGKGYLLALPRERVRATEAGA